jgi:hypothetical protein
MMTRTAGSACSEHMRGCLGGRAAAVSLRALTSIAAAVVPACAIAAVASANRLAADAGPATPAATYSIDAHIFAAGSAVQSSNACYRLHATLAEPAVGYATNPGYALSTGFRAIAQTLARDDLFFSSFEACP